LAAHSSSGWLFQGRYLLIVNLLPGATQPAPVSGRVDPSFRASISAVIRTAPLMNSPNT
jgi:hypothetical protein